MIVKHIDPTPPLDVIKDVWDAITAKRWTDLELWANLGYLVSWSLWFLSQKVNPDGPVFGDATPEQAEFCSYCIRVHQWATDGSSEIQQSAIGAWIIKAMLVSLLNRLVREIAADGLPDWLAEIIQDIKDKIEAL